MYREVKYTVKIQPQPQKNLRKNINAFYIVLISDKDSHGIYSQPLLIDSQGENDLYSTNDIEYSRMELWNYDKMKIIEQQKTVFSMSDNFTFTCKSEEIIYSVAKTQVTKSSKIIDPTKSNLTMISGLSSGRNNSEGQYQLLMKAATNRYNDSGKKSDSEQESSRTTRNNKSPSYRIISAKQYHAY